MPENISSLKIVNKQKETDNAYIFTLDISADLKHKFKYISGQYITIHITDKNNVKHNRHYSICGPIDSPNISFCVKPVKNGLISNLLCDEYNVGDTLQIGTPAGEFILDNSIIKNYGNLVFITGGSGITPIKSMINQALVSNFKGKMFLIYANRNIHNIIFNKYFKNIHNDKLVFICSVDTPSEGWAGEVGQLSTSKIEDIFSKYEIPYKNTCFFSSGPPIIIKNTRDHLQKNGVDLSDIKFENFFIDVPSGTISTETHIAKIKTEGKTHTLSIPPNQSILNAALTAGINIEHNCKVGNCLTCVAKLKCGKVYSAIKLNDDSNRIITCQSYPLNDAVEVDFDQGIIQQILYRNRNALIACSLLLSFFMLLFFLNPKNESYLAKGDFNTGHENLNCVDCHKSAPGIIRQQLQKNARSFLSLDHSYAHFGTLEVSNVECLNCHNRPNDIHPTHRFLEPRFASARKEIQPQNCVSCHSEHTGKRVTIGQTDFCINCHQDIKINNDPLDIKHEDLISTNQWNTCLQCHDFHGNHLFEIASKMKDTIPLHRIETYFDGGKDPYGEIKKYISDLSRID